MAERPEASETREGHGAPKGRGSRSHSIGSRPNMSDAPAEIRIVLLGKSGSGKSGAGNVILGEEKFDASSNPNGVTKDCQTEERSINGWNISVTNTPGIFEQERSDEDLKYSIISCLAECAPGPHTFILVLRVGRHTKEQEDSVEMILKYFGEEALKHTVVLFTHGDQLENNQTINEHVEMNKYLKKVVDKCGGRVHVIDSKYWNRTEEEPGQGSGRPISTGRHPDESEYRSNSFQVKELLRTIETMVRYNRGYYYTNELLQEIKDAIDFEMAFMQAAMVQNTREIRRQARERVRIKTLKLLAGTAVVAVGALLFGAPIGAFAIGLLKRAGTAGVIGAIGGIIAQLLAEYWSNKKQQ